MFFLCDSTELWALETLIQSQHHYNLLVRRWLIRNLVCIILHFFSERMVLSVILITKIPFFFSPLFFSLLPDSVLLLSGGCSKIFKAGSFSPIFKREEMAIIFAVFKKKKKSPQKNLMNYLRWYFKQKSILSSCFKSLKHLKVLPEG